MLCRISRFDARKDPVGVIDAYRLAKASMPAVQFALVGFVASDDPCRRECYERTIAHAVDDPDILIRTDCDDVGDLEVGSLQALADVRIQKSTREGFGLTVSEALWRTRPIVGGIALQVRDWLTGHLVSTIEARVKRGIELFRDPMAGAALGRGGREHVRAGFLMPRSLRDLMRICSEVVADA